MPALEIKSNKVLVMDGAMGTELIRRGLNLPLPLWSAEANLTHGDLVLEIHQDYISRGADIITTNTFRTSTWSYRKAGFTVRRARERARDSLERAVDIAFKAAAGKIVAGSVTSLEDCYKPRLFPGKSAAEDSYGETTEWFQSAGIKLILFETMGHQEEVNAALEAAASLDLTCWLSLLLKDEEHIFSGALLTDILSSLNKKNLEMLLFNCSTIKITALAIPALVKYWKKPWGVYPNLGKTEVSGDGSSIAVIDEFTFRQAALDYLKHRPAVLGTCCGSSPFHVGLLRKLVDKQL
ncbi:MAG: homocysteine S-methyltransferase family protein [Candidatus Neomarinimicrobiota bacterium]